MTKLPSYLAKDLGCTIDSIIEKNINVSKYQSVYNINYVKFPNNYVSQEEIHNIDDSKFLELEKLKKIL